MVQLTINDKNMIEELKNKSTIDKSILLLKEFEKMAIDLNPNGYYLCYSGGKDSDLLLDVAIKSGVKFTANYNVTGIDPKECILHIKKKREELRKINVPLYMHPPKKFTTGLFKGQYKNMWRLIIHKGMPPTRLIRYCCDSLKEHGGEGSFCLTGVRWAESNQRKKRKPIEILSKKKENRKLFNDNSEERRQFENCLQKGKRVVNPIIHVEDKELWQYIEENEIETCCLYKEGNKRIGCIGCPTIGAKGMERDFKKYPEVKKRYIEAYKQMLQQLWIKGVKTSWKTGEDVLEWQMYGTDKEHKKEIENQIEL